MINFYAKNYSNYNVNTINRSNDLKASAKAASNKTAKANTGSDSIHLSQTDQRILNAKKAQDVLFQLNKQFMKKGIWGCGTDSMAASYTLIIDAMKDSGIDVSPFFSGNPHFVDTVKEFGLKAQIYPPLSDKFGEFCDSYKQGLIQAGVTDTTPIPKNDYYNNVISVIGLNTAINPPSNKKCPDPIKEFEKKVSFEVLNKSSDELSKMSTDITNAKKAKDAFYKVCSSFKTPKNSAFDISELYGKVLSMMNYEGIDITSFFSGSSAFVDKVKDFEKRSQNNIVTYIAIDSPGKISDPPERASIDEYIDSISNNFSDFCDQYKEELIKQGL